MQMGVGHVLLPPAGGPKSMVLGMLSRNKGRSIAGQALIETLCPGCPELAPATESGHSTFQQLADECVRECDVVELHV